MLQPTSLQDCLQSPLVQLLQQWAQIFPASEFIDQGTNKECPFKSKDWDDAGFQQKSAARAKRDIKMVRDDPVENVFIVQDEENVMALHALIIGNFNTPYEGGFYHFYIRFGPNYPAAPPRVSALSGYKFGELIRFNPTMYPTGMVCLSILGTWQGPGWTPENNLRGVLLGLQSLLVDQALCIEPGYEIRQDTGCKMVWQYDLYVRHETIRVTVLHSIKQWRQIKIPEQLVTIMKSSFLEYYDHYIITCIDNIKYDGVPFATLYNPSFTPNFAKLKKDLIALHAEIASQSIDSTALDN